MAFDKSPETEELREHARSLGLKFHPATGAKKLRALLAEYAKQTMGLPPEDAPVDQAPAEAPAAKKEENKGEYINRIREEQLRLIRVIVHCNNDDKRELQGDLFSAANKHVGPVKRFIPFDNENGWHIEKILLDFLKAKRVQKWRNVKLPNGMSEKQPYLTNEFTIEELPPLTREQLDDLAREQAARGSIDRTTSQYG